jgi:hypothetical protein
MHFNKDQRAVVHKSATSVTSEIMRALKLVARSHPTDRELQDAAKKIRESLLRYANTIMSIQDLADIPDFR